MRAISPGSRCRPDRAPRVGPTIGVLAWGLTLLVLIGGLPTGSPPPAAADPNPMGAGASGPFADGPVGSLAPAVSSGSTLPSLVADSPIHWLRNASGPIPARIDAAVASDPATGVVVAFGGYENNSAACPLSTCALGDTWVRTGGAWTNVTPGVITPTDSPAARWGAGMAFDPLLGEFVLFGGTSTLAGSGRYVGENDTWLFSPGTDRWTPACSGCPAPAGRWDPSMSYDPAVQAVVLFGGLAARYSTQTPFNDTWTFNGSAWTPQDPVGGAPTARSSAAFAWDAQIDALLLYGGIPANAQTWTYTAGTWHLVDPTSSPGAVGGGAAATDPVNGSVVLVGGCATDPCTTGPVNATWSYANGSWARLAPLGGVGPLGRDHAGLVPVPSPLGLLLFGGDAVGQASNATWTGFHLEARSVVATPTAVDAGQPITLNVSALGGIAPYQYTWIGLPTGCTGSDRAGIVCLPSGPGPETFTARARVTDAIGDTVTSPGPTVSVHARPTVAVLANPTNGTVPLVVDFSVVATGGTGPLAIAWNFGDGNLGLGATPAHTYATAGAFTAEVWANDSVGGTANYSIQVTTFSPLTVTLSVSPSGVERTGNRTVLSATAHGGDPPYAYAFSTAPSADCSASEENTVVCTVPTAGEFPVSVTVTDAGGRSARAETNLTVLAPVGPSVHRASPIAWLASWAGLTGIALAAALAAAAGLLWVGRRRRARSRRQRSTIPVPEPHELPPVVRSGYVPYGPPPTRRGPRRP